VLTNSATDNGSVTGHVSVFVVATKLANTTNSASGQTNLETTGTT
jgi:hypothetical protein